MKISKRPTPEMVELLRSAAHPDPNIALANYSKVIKALDFSLKERVELAEKATRERSEAVQLPLVPGVLNGDIISGIFAPEKFERGVNPEWPLDLLAPGTEGQHIAYTIPNAGYIPEMAVEGDYVMAKTYRIGNSIDCNLKFIEDARWDVVARMMQILEAGFVRKMNDDGWHVILAAIVTRNLFAADTAATAGLFTRRVVSLAQLAMRRGGGGNSTSTNRRKLTHMATSPENIEDMRSWDNTQVDDITRREMFLYSEDGIQMVKINGVVFIPLEEFGVSQAYTDYFTDDLATAIPSSKVEISAGLDLSGEISNFIMPYRGENRPVLFEDPVLHRQQRFGYYGWREVGFASLDGRTALGICN